MDKDNLMEADRQQLQQATEEVTTLVTEGKVAKGLSHALRTLVELDDEQEIIGMLSRWKQAEKDWIQRLVTQDQFEVTKSRVTKQLLTFVKRIEDILEAPIAITKDMPPAPDPEPQKIVGKAQVMILYSAEDQTLWHSLQKHFFMLFRMAHLQFVDFQKDLPEGLQDTFSYQEKWVTLADKVICLVTPNMLTYPTYPLAEQAALAGKLIPIKYTEVDLADTVFDPLSSLPSDNRFISEWPDQNSAMVNVVSKLRPFLQKIARLNE